MNFPSQKFFNDINHGYRTATMKKKYLWLLPFYMTVATYFYYEKMRKTMRTAIVSYLFKLQPPKMAKHTQTIRQLLLTNCLSVFDHFMAWRLKG